MEIKNINIGLIFLLVSAIIYGSTLISASIYSQVIADTSWDKRYGIFGTALRKVGTLPLLIVTLSTVIGFYLIVKSIRQK